MLDGIYSITFRGREDWGLGMLILQNGTIIGVDSGGVEFDGQYSDGALGVEVKVTMTVPAGATLVQGTRAQPFPYTVPFTLIVPRIAFDNAQPVLLELPPGPVNVIFRRLRKL